MARETMNEPRIDVVAGDGPHEGGAAPFWNILSVAVPLGALALGLLLLAADPRGGGDYAGAIGGAVLFVFGVGGACAFGAVAAIVALARDERKTWLSVIGLVGNGAVVLPIVALLLGD
jgi:hypothetical protein